MKISQNNAAPTPPAIIMWLGCMFCDVPPNPLAPPPTRRSLPAILNSHCHFLAAVIEWINYPGASELPVLMCPTSLCF